MILVDTSAWVEFLRDTQSAVRKLIDCLIGAVAIRADAEMLHADRDFDALARCTQLRIARL